MEIKLCQFEPIYKLNLIRSRQQFLNRMAQKLGLALVALFGLVQCEISILRSIPYGLVNLAPAGTHHHQADSADEEEGQGPKLGGNDPHLGLSIVNFSTKTHDVDLYDSFGQIVKPNYPGSRRFDSKGRSNSKGRSGSSGKRGDRSEERKAARSGSKGKSGDWKGYEKRGNSPKRINDGKPPVRVVVTQAVRNINLESNSHHEEAHSEDEHPPKKVPIPIFTKLNYVDTDDSHGEATKAPITIVTAPLVSTAEIDRHRVPINQVLGKSNCPECIEENREAAKTKKAADKALQRDDNLLKTKIQAPIKKVEVAIEENHSKNGHNERHERRGGERRSGLHKRQQGNSHSDSKTECTSSEERGHQANSYETKYSGKNLDQKAVYRSLAIGEARENAPFVVSSVVIPPQGNLKRDHDDHDSHDDHNDDNHYGRRHN